MSRSKAHKEINVGPIGEKDTRLSWEETFEDMARQREDWGDFEAVVGDGLDKEFW